MAVKPHPNKGQSKASGGGAEPGNAPSAYLAVAFSILERKKIVKTNESIAVDKVAKEIFFAALSIVNSANSGHSTPGFFYRKWQMEII